VDHAISQAYGRDSLSFPPLALPCRRRSRPSWRMVRPAAIVSTSRIRPIISKSI